MNHNQKKENVAVQKGEEYKIKQKQKEDSKNKIIIEEENM